MCVNLTGVVKHIIPAVASTNAVIAGELCIMCSHIANYSGELSQLTKYVARETYFIAFIWHTFIRTYFSPVYIQAVCMKKIYCNVPDQILDTDWLNVW